MWRWCPGTQRPIMKANMAMIVCLPWFRPCCCKVASCADQTNLSSNFAVTGQADRMWRPIAPIYDGCLHRAQFILTFVHTGACSYWCLFTPELVLTALKPVGLSSVLRSPSSHWKATEKATTAAFESRHLAPPCRHSSVHNCLLFLHSVTHAAPKR